jgi:hypothetical protein
MNCWRRFRSPRIGAIALTLLPLWGSPPARSQDLSAAAVTHAPILIACGLCDTRWEAPTNLTSAVFANTGPRLHHSTRPNVRRDPFQELAFRDNEPLVNRLRRIQAVALVTVWDTTSATLYLGVNRDGEPGLHLRQKKYDRGTLAPANRTIFSDITPWRAAMLAGQPRFR